MNITSLSQELNISVKELRQKLAEAGFRVSPRARKIDNILANEILDKLKPKARVVESVAATVPKKIAIPAYIAVRDLALLLIVPATTVIKILISNGVMASLNEQIDFDAAAVVASELGFEVVEETEKFAGGSTVAEVIAAEPEALLSARPPIVAVMGHVDHGKTKLLDTVRKTNVIATEAGAITQHIGAYRVLYNGKAITFLDTPGHESFAAMRARGANVTDIIVLVVAADDGVKPQTLEVINRAKISRTPMIVAVNKIDKPEANQELVKKQLAEAGVMPEEWGGKYIFVPISAKQGMGVDKLLDMILLTAEVENFRANPEGATVGTVIEAHLSKTQGSIATVIVQNGVLKVGDFVSLGTAFGKVRSLEDENSKQQRQASSSVPVRITGLSALPEVGDLLRVHASVQDAQTNAKKLLLSRSAKRLAYKTGIATDKENQQLKLIVKADTNGSLEAIMQELSKLENQEVALTVVSQGIGDINESDVLSAESSAATLIGFHNTILPSAARLAKQKKVHIDIYDIIYELTEDITRAILQLVIPEVEHIVTATAKVMAIFRTERESMIIGGKVTDGKLIADRRLQIWRAGKQIGEGKIAELQSGKLPAREVPSGDEFGMKIATRVALEKNDMIKIVDERMKEKQLTKKVN